MHIIIVVDIDALYMFFYLLYSDEKISKRWFSDSDKDNGKVSDRRCRNSIMLQKEADQRSDGIIRRCRSLYQRRVFYRTTDRPTNVQTGND